MKILDKYIIKKFLGTFFLSMLLIILIVVVVDISEKIEDFLQDELTVTSIIFEYYFNFIPYFVNLFSPLFTFIAVIFFTSRMASRTEIVAILSSGTSYKRLLYPYMIAASAIAFLSLMLNNFIIPHANKNRIDFENTYLRGKYRNNQRNIHMQLSPDNYMYLETFDVEENIGYRFTIEKFKDGRLTYKLMAENIKWDSVKQLWAINYYHIRTINGIDETIKTGFKKDSALGFTPEEFGRKDNTTETMDYFKLNSYIDSERAKGANNIEALEVEKHRRNAVPFATFILTLIGVALAGRKSRGGIGMHIGLGLGLSFLFVMFMQVSTTFAIGGFMSPLLAVWIPNIVFSVIALYLLKVAQK
jgi:lipopolysaccharide export system permease protein